MDTYLAYSLILGLFIFLIIVNIIDWHIIQELKKVLAELLSVFIDRIGSYNIRRHIIRLKKEKVQRKRETPMSKYNAAIEALLYDFNLPLTLEGFNSLVGIIFVLLALIIVIFLKSISLSAMASISIIVGLITLFSMKSRINRAQKIEHIMDAEDLICPLARDGVLNAIKKVLESEEYIHRSIRYYFVQFVDNCENHGYSFKRAMEILNRQLGPKFDNFAKKAITFEYNERKGMADIFLDIVDENAGLREINLQKNLIFKRMNRSFMIKTAMILVFVTYCMTYRDIREFMMNNEIGRFINTIAIVSICLGFSRCQMLQSDIDSFGGVR